MDFLRIVVVLVVFAIFGAVGFKACTADTSSPGGAVQTTAVDPSVKTPEQLEVERKRAADEELTAATLALMQAQSKVPATSADIARYEAVDKPAEEAARRRWEAAMEAVDGPNWREIQERRVENAKGLRPH